MTGGIISKNIEAAKKYGAAITVKPVIETVIQVDEADVINQVIERSTCQTAVAPQTFALSKIHSLHLKAQAENQFDMTDSATLARYFGLLCIQLWGAAKILKLRLHLIFIFLERFTKRVKMHKFLVDMGNNTILQKDMEDLAAVSPILRELRKCLQSW